MEQIIRFPGGSLASRHSAIPFRDQIIRLFEDNNYSKIIIDLSDTEIISGSFADECIGILVKIYGWDAVKSKIRLINGNGQADRSIAKAILDRKNESDEFSLNQGALTPRFRLIPKFRDYSTDGLDKKFGGRSVVFE